MRAYKVEYNLSYEVHVSATSREEALYAAFDEATDRGHVVNSIGDVWMLDDATQQWVKTNVHTHA